MRQTFAPLRAALFALAPALLLAPGCGLSPEIPDAAAMAAREKAGTTFEAFDQHRSAGDAAWGRRHEGGAQVKAAIAAYEKAFAVDPYDRHVLQQLTLACYYDGNYFSADEAAKEAVHVKGNGYGVLAARLNPRVRDLEAQGKTFEEAVAAAATPGDVPALYWLSVNKARAVEGKGIGTRAAEAPKLKLVMETIYRLGPSYYWGGVHRFFGAYYVKAPGQSDPGAQSKREFEAAVKRGPENLENKVLMAEYWASFVQDREAFERILKEVLAVKAEKDHPALRLDNTEARKRAKKLLEEIDDRF